MPHVLFGEVSNYARDLARRDDTSAARELGALLDHIEAGLSSDESYIVELVRDSFIENAQPPSDYAELRAQLMQRPLLAPAYVEVVGAGYW